MSCKSLLLRTLALAALTVPCAGASAQADASYRLHCQMVGHGPAEPLGDRDGHAVSAGTISCRVEGGPMDGGVLTGTSITEWDRGNGVILSGVGITRRPGAATAYQQHEGKVSLLMTDGKVTGHAGSGRGRYTLATGAAAALQGKAYSYSYRGAAGSPFVIDVRTE